MNPARRFTFSACVMLALLSCQSAPPAPPAPAATAPKSEAAVPSVAPLIAATMTGEFADAFRNSPGCRDVHRWTKGEEGKADFQVNLAFAKADTPEMEEEWLWTVFDVRHGAHDFRGSGTTDSPADAVREMCKNVLDNFNSRN